MIHKFFFFTIEECYQWLEAISTPSLRFVVAGTHQTIPPVYSLKNLPVFSEVASRSTIGDSYLVSEQDFFEKTVPRSKGDGSFFVFDRTTNRNAWLITFGGTQGRLLFPGELTGEIVDMLGKRLFSEFRKLVVCRSANNRYCLSKAAVSLHNEGFRLLPGMNALAETAFDVVI